MGSGFSINALVARVSDFARVQNDGRLTVASTTSLQWDGYQIGGYSYAEDRHRIITPSSVPSLANTALDLDGNALTYDAQYDIFASFTDGVDNSFSLVAKKFSSGNTRAVTPAKWLGRYSYDNTTPDGKKRLWLGTVRLYNDGGTAKFVDSINKRFVVNEYNGIQKPCEGYASSSSPWDWNTASYREFGGGSTVTRAEFLCLSTEEIFFDGSLMLTADSVSINSGLAINQTTGVNSLPVSTVYLTDGPKEVYVGAKLTPAIGYNYVTFVEYQRIVVGTTSNRHRWICESMKF